jgi:hypothetical protein
MTEFSTIIGRLGDQLRTVFTNVAQTVANAIPRPANAEDMSEEEMLADMNRMMEDHDFIVPDRLVEPAGVAMMTVGSLLGSDGAVHEPPPRRSAWERLDEYDDEA